MFKWLKNRAQARHRAKNLFQIALNNARNRYFYHDLRVSDSTAARYEILCIHLFLLLERLKQAENTDEISQRLTELFINELNEAYQDIEVSDLSPATYVKRLIAGFYERCHAYQFAMDGGDEKMLAMTIANYVYANSQPDHTNTTHLALYMICSHNYLAAQPLSQIKAAKFRFPPPETAYAGHPSDINNDPSIRNTKSN